MTRYTLRALAAQWRAWSGTVAVLAFAAGLINVCLVHRMTVTRPDVVAAARAAGVDPAELVVPGISVAFYTAMVTVPVVAVVGQSCVQALRTSWALWRLAGALPRQVLAAVLATVAVLGLVACVPGILLGMVAAQPFASVLTRLAAARMGRIEVAQTPTTLLLTVLVVVTVAVLGAVGPARAAVRTPAVEAVRDTASEGRRRMGVGRWILAGVWALACAGQLLLAFLAPPGRKIDGWPTGGGQAILASLLLAVLVVLLAPALIPRLLWLWSAPLAAGWTVAHRAAFGAVAQRVVGKCHRPAGPGDLLHRGTHDQSRHGAGGGGGGAPERGDQPGGLAGAGGDPRGHGAAGGRGRRRHVLPVPAA